MTIKPEISIFGTAHRPENWMGLYRSIGQNDINFEIIFVGPNEPDFELPSNFIFIKSNVKPTQCLEIAARKTTADLIMNIADDVEFRTNHALDKIYNIYKSYNNEKLILSCRYMLNGEDISNDSHHFFVVDKSSPIMPLSGLMSRKLYRHLGGIDRNFIAVMWDCDIAMRVLAMGGEVALCDVFLDELKSKSCGSQLCFDYWRHDRGLVEALWSINGKTHFNRSKPFEPFTDFKLLEESQGPRGRWHGSSPLILEKLANFANYYLTDFYWQSRSFFSYVWYAMMNPRKAFEYAKRIFHRFLFRT